MEILHPPTRSILLFWVLILSAANTAYAANTYTVEWPQTGPARHITNQTVKEIVDGDTLKLLSGKEVRLVGIQAPKLPLGRAGFKTWPLADDSRTALKAIAGSGIVSLHFAGRREDRYRRYLAHLTLPDGTWVQGELLAKGMARVYSFKDNRKLISEMLALERSAREHRRGIWRLPYYRIRTPAETSHDIDSFQIVEGRVVDAARVRNVVYINFGPNWRTDFTFRIDRRALRLFERAGINPLTFSGRTIRGRGWIKRQNGPLIDITHPEQLELLSE